jgi:hypothetical protein
MIQSTLADPSRECERRFIFSRIAEAAVETPYFRLSRDTSHKSRVTPFLIATPRN